MYSAAGQKKEFFNPLDFTDGYLHLWKRTGLPPSLNPVLMVPFGTTSLNLGHLG
jgi:hypothetical protein